MFGNDNAYKTEITAAIEVSMVIKNFFDQINNTRSLISISSLFEF